MQRCCKHAWGLFIARRYQRSQGRSSPTLAKCQIRIPTIPLSSPWSKMPEVPTQLVYFGTFQLGQVLYICLVAKSVEKTELGMVNPGFVSARYDYVCYLLFLFVLRHVSLYPTFGVPRSHPKA